MAKPRRYLNTPSDAGVRQDAALRSQDSFRHLPGDAGADIDMAAVDRNSRLLAQHYAEDPAAASAGLTGLIQRGLASETPEKFESFVRALQLIDSQSPGAAARIVSQAGSPEDFASYFPASPDAAAAEPSAGGRKQRLRLELPPLERAGTYGAGGYKKDADGNVLVGPTGRPLQTKGLGELAKEEIRSAQSRVENADSGKAWVQRAEAFMAHQGMYAKLRDLQVARIIEMGYAPDEVARMTRSQMDAIAPVDMSALSPEMLSSAGKLEASAARRNRNAGEASYELSTRDKKLSGMLNAAEFGETPKLDDWFKWWRYQFPTAQGGEIVRPGLAPSGEFLARLTRGTMGLFDSHPDWVAQTTPVFDRAIRQQAFTRPKETSYMGGGGMTAMDFSKLLLDPERGGYALRQAEGNWPFPQYTDGLYMWKDETPTPLGDSTPGPITRGLLDEQGVEVRPASTISTPDTAQPEVMPADKELGMYDPRQMNPALLAALLA